MNNSMKKLIYFPIIFFNMLVCAQDMRSTDTIPAKGSYLFFGQPRIEDNSMFLEEAFNQDPGAIQHISNFVFDEGEVTYSYTQEIPLFKSNHQISFTVPYSTVKRPDQLTAIGIIQFPSGFGDLMIHYRPTIWGKNHPWAMVIPRFSLIIPTGSGQHGLGSGVWGSQFNLAVTKRFSRKILTTYNVGFTVMFKSHYDTYDGNGKPVVVYERDIFMKNVGVGLIFLAHPKYNLMLEYASNFEEQILDDGAIESVQSSVVNPGFRFAFNVGRTQVVPGLGFPLKFQNGEFLSSSTFIYFSIEPAY
jgi:hypothetical protein